MNGMGLIVVGLVLAVAGFQAWRRARFLVAVGVLWTFWWAEVGLRAWAWASVPVQVEDGIAEPPWTDAVAGHAVPEALLKRANADARVLFVGDSFTYGVLVPEEQRVSDRVQAELGPGVSVLNHGLPGYEFSEQLLLYETWGAGVHPDVVVWNFVLNDLGFVRGGAGDLMSSRRMGWEPIGLRVVDVPMAIWDAARVSEASEAAYRLALAPDGVRMRVFREELEAVVTANRARGARVLLVIWPLLHRLNAYPFEEEHRLLAEVASKHGAEVVDLLEVFRHTDERDWWAREDDHHPNGAANELAARAVLAQLRAGPIPDARPSACGPLVSFSQARSVSSMACRGGWGPEALVGLAASMSGMEVREERPPLRLARVAKDLAVLGWKRAEDLEDPGHRADVRRQAEQILEGNAGAE